MSTAASSSDRYAAAREALKKYDAAIAEPDDDPGYHKRMDAALDCIEPLRALITPSATDETVPEIVEQIAQKFRPDYFGAEGEWAYTAMRLAAMLWHAVHAGIQAAHESWEPENAPGVRVVMRAEYDAVVEVIHEAKIEAHLPVDRFAARIFDALGMTL